MELTRRGVPASMYVLSRIRRPSIGQKGAVSVEIREVPGDTPEQLDELIAEINRAIEKLETGDREGIVEESAYRVEYDPSADVETRGVFGKELTVRAELERVVRIALKDKAKHPQTKAVGKRGDGCVITIDCRSLYEPLGEAHALRHEERHAEGERRREGIRQAARATLAAFKWVSGVVLAWSLPRWEAPYKSMVHRPWTLELVTRDRLVEVSDAKDFAAAITELGRKAP